MDNKLTLTPDSELMLHTPAKIDGEIALIQRRIQTLLLEVNNLNLRLTSREEEYRTRGGWTRGFLVVTNGHGHLHKDRSCSTCYATTRYSWMTEVSGKSEEELVALAGERACTVCYPTAPVEVLRRPTQLFTPEEVEAKRVRDEKKAKRSAEETLKGIANPDGSVIRLPVYGTVRTLVTACNTAVDLMVYLMAQSDNRIYTHLTLEQRYRNMDEYQKSIGVLVAAIAHKRNTSDSLTRHELQVKANKKFKHEYADYSADHAAHLVHRPVSVV